VKIYYTEHDKIDTLGAGASIYYNEISQILGKEKNSVGIEFDDLDSVTDIVSKIGEKDVLVCNNGLYAWYYYYLRKKLGKKFRIIHDIQTGLFFDGILQQFLIEGFMEDRDCVVFLSEFQRQLYMKIFPEGVRRDNSFVCNPFLMFVEKNGGINEKKDKKILRLAWIGRVCDAKNFNSVIDVMIKANRVLGKRVMLNVVGKADKKYMPSSVRKVLRKENIDPKLYNHIGNGNFVDRKKALEVLQSSDVLLFTSTANYESFGRVIGEAIMLGKKVIATEHGASSEMLEKENLISTKYNDEEVSLFSANSLGEINVDEVVDKLIDVGKLKKGDIGFYADHDKKLMRIINNVEKSERKVRLRKSVKNFIEKTRLFLNSDINVDKNELLEKANKWLCSYLENKDIVKGPALLAKEIGFKPSAFIQLSSYPKLVVVELTRKCTNNCIMCYNQDGNSRKMNFVGLDYYKVFINQLDKIGTEILSLTGGEPLLVKELPEVVEYAEKKGINCVVFTNGIVFDRKIGEKLLKSGLTRLFFSLDHVDEKVNDRIRGKGSFKKTVDAVNLALSLRDRLGVDTSIMIGTTIQKLNSNSLVKTAEFSKKLGVDGITFKPVRAHNTSIEKGDIVVKQRDDIKVEDVWPEQNVVNEIDNLIKWKLRNGFVFDRIEFLRIMKEYFTSPDNKKLCVECRNGDDFFVVDENGNVMPCWGVDFSFIHKNRLGNIREKGFDLENVWSSRSYDNIRECMKKCKLPCYNLLLRKSYLR